MPVGLTIGALGAAGSLGGALIGSSAAKDAANIQSTTAKQIAEMQAQLGMQGSQLIGTATNQIPGAVNQAQSLLSPYIGAGNNALTSLASLYGVSTPGNPGGQQGQNQAWSNMLQTPAYQFAQQQGQLGLDRSSAASGLLLSGAQLKDTMQFNQGLATQQIGNYTNALQGMAGMGQSASTQSGQFGLQGAGLQLQGAQGQASALTGTAQMVGNTSMSGAQSAASGIVGSANALTGGINSATNNALTAYGISRMPNYGGVQSNQGSMFGNGQMYNPSSYSNSFWNSQMAPGSNPTTMSWG